jgi:hypothetical protein
MSEATVSWSGSGSNSNSTTRHRRIQDAADEHWHTKHVLPRYSLTAAIHDDRCTSTRSGFPTKLLPIRFGSYTTTQTRDSIRCKSRPRPVAVTPTNVQIFPWHNQQSNLFFSFFFWIFLEKQRVGQIFYPRRKSVAIGCSRGRPRENT